MTRGNPALVALLALALLGAGSTEQDSGEFSGKLATLRWVRQDADHRLYSGQLAVLVENKSAEPLLAQWRWSPVVCGGIEVPLYAFTEPRLIDLVGDLPKVHVVPTGRWRIAVYPIGLPLAQKPAGENSCFAHVVVIVSTREGEKERFEVNAPISAPPVRGEESSVQ